MYASRVLGPEGIGKVEVGKNISGFFVLIASLGINSYGIREGARLRNSINDFSRFVHEILMVNLISMLVALSLFIILCSMSPLEPYKSILLVFGATIVLTPMGIDWVYGALEEYKYITLRTLLFQVLAVVVLILFVQERDDVIWYSVVLIVSNVGSNIMNLVHARKFVLFKNLGSYNLKKHLRPIVILFPLAISNFLYSYIDTTMIGFMVGDIEVGLYAAALKVNRIVVNIIGAVGAVMMPRLSYLWSIGDKDEFDRIAYAVINGLMLISIPCCFGIIGLSNPILRFFCGTEYLEAELTMKILSTIVVILSLSMFFNMHILIPVNKESYVLKAIVSGLVVNVGMTVFLIPYYGRNGAAIGTVIGESVVLLLAYRYINGMIDIKRVVKNIIQCLISATTIIPICAMISSYIQSIFIQMLLSVACSVALYISILVLLRNRTMFFVLETLREYVKRKV